MRRPRRGSITGISDTWNYRLRTVDDSFGFTRDFTDKVNQEMLDEERIEMKHRKEEAQRQEPIYPSCDLSDRPNNL
jgi:hypothetical protein